MKRSIHEKNIDQAIKYLTDAIVSLEKQIKSMEKEREKLVEKKRESAYLDDRDDLALFIG